jgi:hypothetical protein
VDQSPGGPWPVDLAHGIISSKINLKFRYFGHFSFRPLSFLKINPQSMIFAVRSGNLKNNSKKVPSLRKIHKNSPKTSKIQIISTTTPKPVILVPKFLESLPLSFYAFM